MNKAAVRGLLVDLQREDRLGPDFLNDDQKQEWNDWLEQEPDSHLEVATAEWPLPIRMPFW